MNCLERLLSHIQFRISQHSGSSQVGVFYGYTEDYKKGFLAAEEDTIEWIKNLIQESKESTDKILEDMAFRKGE